MFPWECFLCFGANYSEPSTRKSTLFENVSYEGGRMANSDT